MSAPGDMSVIKRNSSTRARCGRCKFRATLFTASNANSIPTRKSPREYTEWKCLLYSLLRYVFICRFFAYVAEACETLILTVHTVSLIPNGITKLKLKYWLRFCFREFRVGCSQSDSFTFRNFDD